MQGTAQTEAEIRRELGRYRNAPTEMAIGVCAMVVGVAFLVIALVDLSIVLTVGALLAVLIGLLLYNKGHLERRLAWNLQSHLAGQGRTQIPSDTKFCKHCGSRIAKDSTYCEHCGKKT